MALAATAYLIPATYLQRDGTFDRLLMPDCPTKP
jgi:hypothetical protein